MVTTTNSIRSAERSDHAFLRAVVHGDGVALPSRVVRQTVASVPHISSGRSVVMAVVAARPAAAPDPRRGEQPRLAHQPQHPALRSTHAGQAQPRPGLR